MPGTFGRKIDIVTSSPVLAKWDCEDQEKIYKAAGITVAAFYDQSDVDEEERTVKSMTSYTV
jgi:hypothetical protein